MQAPDHRDTSLDALHAARHALGVLMAEAFIAERDARASTATPSPAPTAPRLNRHERRRLAALARKP